jgi:lysophospholipase L1-like esterase
LGAGLSRPHRAQLRRERGDTTIGLERRLSQIVAARPAKIFLLIGTNDLGNHGATPEEIVANYAKTLDRLAAELPQTQVFVQSVLPREPHNAEAVREINTRLAALAAGRGVRYVDIYTPFAVEGGRLDPSITDDDLHLTEAGYARWRGRIDAHVRTPGP